MNISLKTVEAIKQTDWPTVIEEIQRSGTLTPDGEKWTYERIGKAVGLSKTTIGKLVKGDLEDPRELAGNKLKELYFLAIASHDEE